MAGDQTRTNPSANPQKLAQSSPASNQGRRPGKKWKKGQRINYLLAKNRRRGGREEQERSSESRPPGCDRFISRRRGGRGSGAVRGLPWVGYLGVRGVAWRGVALGRRIRVSSRARGGSPGQKRKAVVHVKGLC